MVRRSVSLRAALLAPVLTMLLGATTMATAQSALATPSDVFAWGENSQGQLGNGDSGQLGSGTETGSTVPVTVNGLTGATAIAAGQYFSLATVDTSTAPPPTVTRMKPHHGPRAGGTLVKIEGTNLTGATAADFGSTAATSFTVNSATSITAVSPAEAAGTVYVTVTTSGGTSAISLHARCKYRPRHKHVVHSQRHHP